MSIRSDGTASLISRYQKKLEKYVQTGEHEKIIYCIHKLKYLPVTVSHLEVTGVGKSINSLRHVEGEVGDKAKALVQKWKQMVSAEEQEELQQEFQKQKQLLEEQEINSSFQDEYEDEDSDEKNCLQIEEKNFNSVSDCDAEDENCNGYDPRTSREDYLSGGVNSETIVSSKPKVTTEKDYDNKQLNDSACVVPSNDIKSLKDENVKYEKKKHHKSKSHHSVRHNSKIHKSKRDSEKSSFQKEPVARDKSNDKDRHKHKHKSNSSNLERSLGSSSPSSSSHNRTAEKSFNRHSLSDSCQNLDLEQSSCSNSSSGKRETNHKGNKPHSSKESVSSSNNDNRKSNSSSSSKQSSKSNEKLKRKKESEVVSSGFEAALMDMDLPSKKKKKKKSKDKEESDSEKKEKVKDIPIRQPNSLDVDYGKNLPSLPSFEDEYDEPMSTQLMTHYRPLPPVPHRSAANDPFNSKMTDEEALNYMLSSRNTNRYRNIYSGKASGLSYVPSLFECCIKVLQENIDALEFTGGVPYDILKPVLERATPQQLFTLEDFNPYLLDDSDELWGLHCRKSFKNKIKEDMENWRDMYIRCTDEQHHRMKVVTENLQKKYITKAPARKTTKLAFVNVAAKPPKNIARAQAKYGTGSSSSAQKPFSNNKADEGISQAVHKNVASSSRPDRPLPQYRPPASKRPKVAPLMAKTRQLMKKVCRR